MKLLEYKAKELFERFGVPTMRGCVVDSAENIDGAIVSVGLTYPVVVKAQVPIGGRGKAGGIRFADSADEAAEHCRQLLHSQLRGFYVRQLLVVEKCDHEIEWYLSILLDRLSKHPMIIFSNNGGMDIEETSRTAPETIHKILIDPLIGIRDYMARYLLSKCGLPMTYHKQLDTLLRSLYRCFCEYDCLLCEINPLIVDGSGTVLALDGKVEIDDSALYRLPDMLEFREMLPEEPAVTEARKFNFLFIPVEKGGSIAVMSNGSGMLMSCIDLITKAGMSVGAVLDLGGGATAERIREAVRILFATEGVKAVLINIFGGITRCDEVAGGLKLAMEQMENGKTVIIRMEGTNKETGLEIVESIPGDIVSVPGLRESVEALLDRRERL